MQPRTEILETSSHFSRLNPNRSGRDLIIGDVHGSLDALKTLVATLKPEDRLFIVGDLIDRGADSFGVIQTIWSHNQEVANQIHVVRGNHENAFIKFIDAYFKHKESLETAGPDTEKLKQRLDSVVAFYDKNGGRWAIDALMKEAEAGLSEEEVAETLKNNEFALKTVRDLLDNLPYLIQVKNRFNIVHADNMFSDEEINEFKSGQTNFTAEQISHLTNARQIHGNLSTARNSLSLPTYCGHSIGGTVRIDTNHLNLDVGAYNSNLILAADHTNAKLMVFGKNGEVNLDRVKNKTILYVNNTMLTFQLAKLHAHGIAGQLKTWAAAYDEMNNINQPESQTLANVVNIFKHFVPREVFKNLLKLTKKSNYSPRLMHSATEIEASEATRPDNKIR